MSQGSEFFKSVFSCTCKDEYSIEPHGKGFALYFGRCLHRHGNNLMQISEVTRLDVLDEIVERMNLPKANQ